VRRDLIPVLNGYMGYQDITAIPYTFTAYTWRTFYFTVPLSKNSKQQSDNPIIKKTSEVLLAVVS
jgi:muramoyltetrapeptide carboxypeptidase LdcA involved in peptidoglycan recycling